MRSSQPSSRIIISNGSVIEASDRLSKEELLNGSTSVNISPINSSEKKITASLVLFTLLLFITPFLYGGRSDLSSSVIRSIFFSFFIIRAIFLNVDILSSFPKNLVKLRFFPHVSGNRFFLYCVPILVFVGIQCVPISGDSFFSSIFSFLSPGTYEAYLMSGAFSELGSGVWYLSLDPFSSRNGFLWILVFSILGAEILSLENYSYKYSSKTHSRKKTKKRKSSSSLVEFGENSRSFDYYSEYLISSVVLVSFILSLVAIFHLALGLDALFGIFSPDVVFQSHSRAHWPFVSPNHLAVVLEIGLIFSFLGILRDRQLRGLSIENREDETLLRKFARVSSQWENQAKELIVFVVLLLGLFLSGSRAGITISLSAISILWIYYKLNPVGIINSSRGRISTSLKLRKRESKLNLILIFVFPVLIVFLAFFFMGDRSRNQLVNRIETSIDEGLDMGRRELQGLSLKVIQQSPLFGVGLNAWSSQAVKFAPDVLAPWKLDYAHNEYLQLFGEVGIIGMLLLLSPIILLGFNCYKKTKENDLYTNLTSIQKLYILGLSLTFFAPLLHSLVDFPMHMPAVSFVMLCSFLILARSFRYFNSNEHIT